MEHLILNVPRLTFALVQTVRMHSACILPKHCTTTIMRYFSDLGVSLSGRGVKHLNMRVFQQNGYCRAFVVPSNPNTADQAQQKAIFSALSQAWGGLSDAQRTAWNSAATSGDFKIPDPKTGSLRNPKSGLELYKSLNGFIATVDGNIGNALVAPPAPAVAGDTLLGAVTASAAGGTVSMAYSGALGANEVHVVRLAAPVSAGRMKERKTLLRVILNNDAAATPIAAGAAFVAKFGAITGSAGLKIFYRVDAYDSGTGATRLVGAGSVVIGA